MYKFEDFFEGMTREEIKEFEDAMEMSVNDFLMAIHKNPFIRAAAELLLNEAIENELAKRG